MRGAFGQHGGWRFSEDGGRFFEDDVRVCPAEAEGAHARKATRAAALPVAPARRDLQRRVCGREVRVEVADVQMRRDVFALKAERGFDEAGDAGGGFEVADVGLDGADETTAHRRAVPRARLRRGQSNSIGSPSGVPVPCAST